MLTHVAPLGRLLRKTRVWRLTVGTVILNAVLTSAAYGHFNVQDPKSILQGYTHASNCDRFSLRDPINMVFLGSGASSAGSLATVAGMSGWANQGGSAQAYTDHGFCRAQSTQIASSEVDTERWHLRFFGGWHVYAPNRRYTLADPHRDQLTSCHIYGKLVRRHVTPWGAKDRDGWYRRSGSGFDTARRLTANLIESDRFPIRKAKWGNTRSMQQCNNTYAGSNGWTYLVGIGYID